VAATRMGSLTTNGLEASATITSAERRRRSRGEHAYYVNYAFNAVNGIEYSREIEVRPSEFADFAAGQKIAIVYDSSDPDNSVLKSSVEQVRELQRNPQL
jgi:hypothetical protein